jgi:hypothetical protein
MKYTRGKNPNSRNGFKKGYISTLKGIKIGKRNIQSIIKQSETRKRMFKEGKLKVWNKDKKGVQTAWNKGLMKKDGYIWGWTKGKKRSKENIEKIRKLKTGLKQSKETIEKRKYTYKKIKLNQKEKNGMWQGGKSFEPYSFEWTENLRKLIRQRDNYTCQLCGKTQRQNSRKLCVHHIDYNKKNCNPNNLITLCNICHNKTNIRREYWIKYFLSSS